MHKVDLALQNPPPTPAPFSTAGFRGLPRPFVFVDLDAFDANAAMAERLSGNKKIRIATKSVRCTTLIRRLMKRSAARYSGVMTTTGAEAVQLAALGIGPTLLVGYPSASLKTLRDVALARLTGADITVMVDSVEHCQLVADAARAHSTTIPVCIDLDMSSEHAGVFFGVRRSPCRSAQDVALLARTIVRELAPEIRLAGLMGYEAQIAGVPDRLAERGFLTRFLIPLLKRRSCQAVQFRRRRALDILLQQEGVRVSIVNGGGSGSLAYTSADPAVTEITVGSAFFAPHLFDGYEGLPVRPAAFFALEVTRRPAPGIVTCHGGGFVASGTPGWEKVPSPVWPEGLSLLEHEGTGEVQTPLRVSGGSGGTAARTAVRPKAEGVPELRLGDTVFFRHAKAGELMEHFSHVYLVANNEVVDRVPTYRGENLSFSG